MKYHLEKKIKKTCVGIFLIPNVPYSLKCVTGSCHTMSQPSTTLHQVGIMILNWPRIFDPYLHDMSLPTLVILGHSHPTCVTLVTRVGGKNKAPGTGDYHNSCWMCYAIIWARLQASLSAICHIWAMAHLVHTVFKLLSYKLVTKIFTPNLKMVLHFYS